MDFSETTEKSPGKETPERWVLWWKPMWITFGLGPLALFAMLAPLWLPRFNVMLGHPFDPFVNVARVVLFLLGVFFLIISLPVYKPAEWRPGQEDEPEDI